MSLPDAFETRLLDACLAGDDPILAALRAQATAATVARREHTGDGVRTYFEVPVDCPAVAPEAIHFSDVDLDVAGVKDGASVSLWIIRGRLAFLEVVAYEGAWPDVPEVRGLRYLQETQIAPGTWAAVPVDTRDPDTLERALAGVQADDYGA
jgi:hypothetical protein